MKRIYLKLMVMCALWLAVVTIGLSQAPLPPGNGPAVAAGPVSELAEPEDVIVNAEETSPVDSRLSLFALILKGGPIMIPMGLMSVIAMAIAAERFASLRRSRVIPADFVTGLLAAIKSDGGDDDTRHAVAHCEEAGGPVGDIFKAGMLRVNRNEEIVEKAIEDAAYREVDKLKRSLKGLAVIASVAPLMGLLGTVYGMISAFQNASIAGMGKADMLAEGIYESLVTTAAGLTLAIPVLIVFQYLSSRVDSLVDEIDEMCHGFMNTYFDFHGKAE
ncbi:MAG: MotA/TolQ/ExbB proton channel family protein [Kiritimatiellae bacterium]|nr:MotA/TolQ/ExbB proton channel family protein [Kiritimatiellia bacterium]